MKLLPIIALGLLPLAVYTGPTGQDAFFEAYTDIGFEARLGPVLAGGSIFTSVVKQKTNPTFSPVEAAYHAWAGVKKDGFSLVAHYMCGHPVAPFWKYMGIASPFDLNRLTVEVRYDLR